MLQLFLLANLVLFFLLPINGKALDLLKLDGPSNLLSISLLLVFAVSWFVPGFDIKRALRNRYFHYFSALFLLYVLSAWFKAPEGSFFSVVSSKLGLIAVPIVVFGNFHFYVKKAKFIFRSFFSGIIYGLLALDIRAYFTYWDSGELLMYSSYSWVIHPTYIGLALLLCLVLIFHRMGQEELSFNRVVINALLVLFILLHVLLLMSRGVILCTVFSLIAMGVYLLIQNWKSFVVYLGISAVPLLSVFAFPDTYKKVEAYAQLRIFDLSYEANDAGSTSFRSGILKRTPELLEKDWLFGVGYGNEEAYLNSYYESINWQYARESSFNMHNQFLQTWLGVGIGGVFVLCVLLFGPFLMPLSPTIKVLLLCFALLFGTEAMMERQAGLLLFALFYTLFVGSTVSKSNRARRRVLTFG